MKGQFLKGKGRMGADGQDDKSFQHAPVTLFWVKES